MEESLTAETQQNNMFLVTVCTDLDFIHTINEVSINTQHKRERERERINEE